MAEKAPLELRSVTKRFGGLVALDSVSAAFYAGQVTSIIGPNGAGKTTAFNVIGGFTDLHAGQIVYRGEVLNGCSPHSIARRGLGRLFQEPRPFDRMTVLENVAAGANAGCGRSAILGLLWPLIGGKQEAANLESARHWLRFVGLAAEADRQAVCLSFGQQKRLALARLLNTGADCLLLDEPTAGITHHAASVLLALIRKLADQGKTVVMIEHNMHAVRQISDVVYVMKDGCVVATGRPEVVMDALPGALPVRPEVIATAREAAS